VPRFTPIADPPHGSVLPNTMAASPESARDTHRAATKSHDSAVRKSRYGSLDRARCVPHTELQFSVRDNSGRVTLMG